MVQLVIIMSYLCTVDVYCGWCGPCTAMEQHLRKLKMAHISSQDRYMEPHYRKIKVAHISSQDR